MLGLMFEHEWPTQICGSHDSTLNRGRGGCRFYNILVKILMCPNTFESDCNTEKDWFDLKKAKNKLTAAITSTKKNYFHLSFEESRNNPKKLWSATRNLTGENIAAKGPTFLAENGEKIRDRVKISEVFNNFFSNLAKNLTAYVYSEFDPTTVSDFFLKFKDPDAKLLFPDISTQEVHDAIQVITTCKATGTDGLSINTG